MDELIMNAQVKEFMEVMKELKSLDNDELDDEITKAMIESLDVNLGPSVIQQAIREIIANLEAQGATRQEAIDSVTALKQFINDNLYGEELIAGNKKIIYDALTQRLFKIFDEAIDMYHMYSITLPIKLDEGAQAPTYAHDSDACADLYALEDVKLDPESYGNKIRTGVSIQLPEGWLAMIFPRSSIGAKTTLRLSNSVGIIDSGYRGELGVLFDNTSHGYVDIHKGDRVAQLLVMPSYRFKVKVVDNLEDSDRGEGGFGSTGN